MWVSLSIWSNRRRCVLPGRSPHAVCVRQVAIGPRCTSQGATGSSPRRLGPERVTVAKSHGEAHDRSTCHVTKMRLGFGWWTDRCSRGSRDNTPGHRRLRAMRARGPATSLRDLSDKPRSSARPPVRLASGRNRTARSSHPGADVAAGRPRTLSDGLPRPHLAATHRSCSAGRTLRARNGRTPPGVGLQWIRGLRAGQGNAISQLKPPRAEWTEPPLRAAKRIDHFLESICLGLERIHAEMGEIDIRRGEP